MISKSSHVAFHIRCNALTQAITSFARFCVKTSNGGDITTNRCVSPCRFARDISDTSGEPGRIAYSCRDDRKGRRPLPPLDPDRSCTAFHPPALSSAPPEIARFLKHKNDSEFAESR